ncbi:hypothetical protein ACFLV9_00305 [Chloroflexota bacterium]
MVVKLAPASANVIGVPGRVIAIRNSDTDTVESLADPVGEKLEGLERRIADPGENLARMEGSNHEGI